MNNFKSNNATGQKTDLDEMLTDVEMELSGVVGGVGEWDSLSVEDKNAQILKSACSRLAEAINHVNSRLNAAIGQDEPSRKADDQKQALLDHYAMREPKRFVQFDGHNVGVDHGDSVMVPDEDGHVVMGTVTNELMHACAVRVLLEPETTKETALILLRKISDWVERGGIEELSKPRAPFPPMGKDGLSYF